MTTTVRKILFASCVLLSALLFFNSGAAKADEYEVAFGVQTKRGQDFGSVTCDFNDVCSARIDSLDLRITMLWFRDEPGRVSINLDGKDISCCYFAGAAISKTVDPHEPLSRVPFFSGEPARGYLLPQNELAGTLYLKFRSHGDHANNLDRSGA
jgi:hypothetical protein